VDFDLSLLLETDGMDIVSDSGDKLICIAALLLLAADNRKTMAHLVNMYRI
jgi:hypothetical protein